jgi:hypothetical protein
MRETELLKKKLSSQIQNATILIRQTIKGAVFCISGSNQLPSGAIRFVAPIDHFPFFIISVLTTSNIANLNTTVDHHYVTQSTTYSKVIKIF